MGSNVLWHSWRNHFASVQAESAVSVEGVSAQIETTSTQPYNLKSMWLWCYRELFLSRLLCMFSIVSACYFPTIYVASAVANS